MWNSIDCFTEHFEKVYMRKRLFEYEVDVG